MSCVNSNFHHGIDFSKTYWWSVFRLRIKLSFLAIAQVHSHVVPSDLLTYHPTSLLTHPATLNLGLTGHFVVVIKCPRWRKWFLTHCFKVLTAWSALPALPPWLTPSKLMSYECDNKVNPGWCVSQFFFTASDDISTMSLKCCQPSTPLWKVIHNCPHLSFT